MMVPMTERERSFEMTHDFYIIENSFASPGTKLALCETVISAGDDSLPE